MKKIFLVIIILVFASVSFAQNIASATQSGSTNSAKITQSEANFNATQLQDGSQNNAIISQTGNSNPSVGTASQTQDGDENKANIIQEGKAFADQYQEGDKNEAKIEGQIQGDDAWQSQIGDENKAFLKQAPAGRHGWSVQTQTGDENYAKIDMANGANKHTTLQTQTGDLNKANIYTNTENYAEQSQIGDENNGSNFGKGYGAEILQYSKYNIAVQNQEGDANYAKTTQDVGDYNDATITQVYHKNKGIVTQLGSSNNATMMQRAGYNTDAENKHSILQEGSNNIASVSAFNGKNTGKVEQEGNENYARTGQTSLSNNAEVYQTGDMHSVYTVQVGQNNNGIIKQSAGNENWASFKSQGEGNIVKIDQIGNNNKSGAEPTWGEPWGVQQVGDNNNADLDQSGDMNDASVKLFGSSNITKVNQVGSNNTSSIVMNTDEYGGPHATADQNNVNIKQDGSFNSLQLNIGRGDNGADQNVVNVNDNGVGHSHRVYVDGSSNNIKIIASGNENGSQYAGNRGDWKVTNGAPVWNETSDNNTLELAQNGVRNIATGKVAGDANDIDINQVGTGNKVGTEWYMADGVVISGNGNSVNIDQLTDGNSAFVSQTGNNNSAVISQ